MSVAVDALRERAAPWVAPVSAAAPAGAAATFDPRYEALRAEIAKLDSPAGAPVEWKTVVDGAGELLQKTSKDLLLGVWLAQGLFETRGIDGLVTGLAALTELLEQFWPTLFPELKRIRGRSNAVAWLIEKCTYGLGRIEQVGDADRGAVLALDAAARRFAEVVRARFEASAPAMGPLLEATDRLKQSLPPEAPPPPPPPPPSATPVAPAAAPAAPAAAPTPAVATLGSDPVQFLRDVGGALLSAAGTLRRADTTAATAYRILRTGLWIHMADAPPAADGTKTSVPAPPAALLGRLEQLAGNEKWADLLEESESALQQHRFALALHRYSARALTGLGAPHARAREAVIAELAALLRRMPQVLTRCFGDGTPFADGATKAWIETEVQPPQDGGGAKSARAGGGLSEAQAAAMAEARKLIGAGQLAEAIALLQGAVAQAASGQDRFRARLEVARACAQGGKAQLALALFESLDQEITARGLEEWQPALAAECLEEHIVCLRTALGPKSQGKSVPSEAVSLYGRLCRLDPAAALRVGN